jgi:hypothetical protein
VDDCCKSIGRFCICAQLKEEILLSKALVTPMTTMIWCVFFENPSVTDNFDDFSVESLCVVSNVSLFRKYDSLILLQTSLNFTARSKPLTTTQVSKISLRSSKGKLNRCIVYIIRAILARSHGWRWFIPLILLVNVGGKVERIKLQQVPQL